MKNALINLLKVKSLMTICVMGVFTYLAVKEKMDTAVVASTITAVTTYYFTKESSREEE